MIPHFKKRKDDLHAYNEAVLALPTYTPNRVLQKLSDMFFPYNDQVNYASMCRLLNCDKCTLSRVVNRHYILTPRLIVTILDLTGWSLEYLRELSGMPPYFETPTEEQLEKLSRGTSKMAKPVQPRNETARSEEDQHSATGEDADSRELGLV